MKLSNLLTVATQYANTNPKQLQLARKGGNAKGVALDFAKFCSKHDQECHAYEGTFRLDNKEKVTHYWNVVGDGIVDDETMSDAKKPYNTLIDFAGKHDFEDAGLAIDLDRRRYTVIKEIFPNGVK